MHIKKLEIIKEEDDEEDGPQIIKTVNYPTIGDYDDDVKFILKTPLNSKERLKRLSKNNLIRNQTDKKNKFSQVLPQKKLIQKTKNQNKDIKYIKKLLLHPRQHLKCKRRKKTGT